MFPLKVLFPSDREYALSAERVEFADVDAIRAALVAVLRDGYADREAREHRGRYLERLTTLSEPGRILEHLIGKPEPVRAGVPLLRQLERWNGVDIASIPPVV
jgi:hypothetical protein